MKRVIASVYYLQGQGLIERGYKPIVDALVKTDGLQLDNLYTVLQVNRITIKRPTGITLVRVINGYKYLLSIKLYIPTQ